MNIAKKRKEWLRRTPEQLAEELIDRELNDMISGYSNYEDGETDPHGHGKRVPYIGWYWRSVSFASGSIPIGNCGDFIGFMENNKWDYPSRYLTEEEAAKVVKIVEKAHDLDHSGGILADIVSNTKAKLEELWPLMQTFEIETSGWWIYGPQGQVGHADTREQADGLIVSLQEAAPGLRYWKEPV